MNRFLYMKWKKSYSMFKNRAKLLTYSKLKEYLKCFLMHKRLDHSIPFIHYLFIHVFVNSFNSLVHMCTFPVLYCYGTAQCIYLRVCKIMWLSFYWLRLFYNHFIRILMVQLFVHVYIIPVLYYEFPALHVCTLYCVLKV